jgi:hypothetical protein
LRQTWSDHFQADGQFAKQGGRTMNPGSRRALFWTPRILSIAYIAFISIFAFDVFGEEHGAWRILTALVVHLIPSIVLTAGLVLAWRWEWIGAAVFAVAGALYITTTLRLRLPAATRTNWILGIGGPCFLIAALFLFNWLKRDELRPRRK